MKMFKKITAWALLSILLQISGLYILENFIFKHTSEFKSNKIEVQKKDITKDIKASIPSKAKDVSISYDGKYLIYKLDEELIWRTLLQVRVIRSQQKAKELLCIVIGFKKETY